MYDFDEIIDRRNTGSLKWDVKENEIPLWVADMDFCAAKPVLDAVSRRAAHGVYGYSVVPAEWYEAIVSWWKRRHDFTIPSDSLYYATGVVPAISSIVRRVTSPNERVVLLTPVYNIFFNSVLNNGRRVLESELVFENGEYKINFSDLEQKFSDKETTLAILCNPHNPVGKIWSKEELAEIGRLSEKYSVNVISDEIHCDVVTPGKKYVPYASVSEECAKNSIVCISATKAFNFAGLQCIRLTKNSPPASIAVLTPTKLPNPTVSPWAQPSPRLTNARTGSMKCAPIRPKTSVSCPIISKKICPECAR